jgi:hypothetical protein
VETEEWHWAGRLPPGTGNYVFRVRARSAGAAAWGPWSAASGPVSAAGALGLQPLPAELTLSDGLKALRRETAALTAMHPEQRRSHLRRLKMRYHPDRASSQQRALFEELSKVLNASTAEM